MSVLEFTAFNTPPPDFLALGQKTAITSENKIHRTIPRHGMN
jgi:hypothetical protein